MAISLERFARHLAPHAEASNEIKSVSAGLKIWGRHRPLCRDLPISPQEASASQQGSCGGACVVERAIGATSRAIRWTVPVPTPHSLAIASMPFLVRSRPWMRFSKSADIRGRPSCLPCSTARLKSCIDPLPDHAAFELSECSGDLKHEATRRGRRVDRLLIQVKIDATVLVRLNCAL